MGAASDGRRAYTILDSACRRDITDLELNLLNKEFDNASIEADVGVTACSITDFSRHLTGVNTRHPPAMRKNDNELTLRLLHAISGTLCPMMHLKAMNEIRAQVHKRAFMNTATGMRDFPAAVSEMDEMWRNFFADGMIVLRLRLEPCSRSSPTTT